MKATFSANESNLLCRSEILRKIARREKPRPKEKPRSKSQGTRIVSNFGSRCNAVFAGKTRQRSFGQPPCWPRECCCPAKSKSAETARLSLELLRLGMGGGGLQLSPGRAAALSGVYLFITSGTQTAQRDLQFREIPRPRQTRRRCRATPTRRHR